MLAIEGVAVANYRAGMFGQETGWQYLWNAPLDWSPENTGQSDTGSIDDPASYRALIREPTTGFWTPAGDLGIYFPSYNLRLGWVGGAPGAAAAAEHQSGLPVGDALDRYAIAAYSIDRTGMYSIADSFFRAGDQTTDGIDVRVYVSGETPAVQRRIDLEPTTPTTDTTNFDTTLGHLSKGDQVYVAFGPGDNHRFDFFFSDFTIYRTSTEIRVADYVDDFRSETPLSGWRYLWNAPTNWQSGSSPGNLSFGSINNPFNFQPLQSTGESGRWTADGDSLGTNNPPANFLQLGRGFGVPGAPNGLSFESQENRLDRYAITSFTVANSGNYSLTDSRLQAVVANNLDGVEVRVFVNSDPYLLSRRSFAGNQVDFDTDLGFLRAGDEIYVAYGANNSHLQDFFLTDFSIQRIVPRVEPLRNLENTVDFFVGDANDDDNTQQIAAAISDARQYQELNDVPVEIHLRAGQVYRVRPGSTNGTHIFELSRYSRNGESFDPRNIVFNGHGSTILIESPVVGFMRITHAENVIISNLEIDYATLPFTQGIIVQIDPINQSIDLRIDESTAESFFPAPTAEQFSGLGRDDFVYWGYAIKGDAPGQITDNSEWLYAPTAPIAGLGNDIYRIQLHQVTGLQLSDRFVLQSRYNRSGLISIYQESEQISVINVKAYASPSTFVTGTYNYAVNVIDSAALIKPGRLKSINGDAVHAQSYRVGPWVENSRFEGVSDDIANFYSTSFSVVGASEDLRTFELVQILTGGEEPANVLDQLPFRPAFQVGDLLTFYQTVSGNIVRPRVEQVEYAENSVVSVTLDQPVFGVLMEPRGLGVGDDSYLNDTTVYNDSLASGFVVDNSEFLNSRRFGLYLMAHRGQITDSIFAGISDQPIAGHNEAGWPLGLFASDILLQNNEFIDNGFSARYQRDPQFPGIVSFNMEMFGSDVLVNRQQAPYANLLILDNVFEQWSKSAISVRNARNVEIRDNLFLAPRPHSATDTRNANRNTAIRVAWSEDVELTGNEAIDLGINSGFDEQLLDATENVTGLVEGDAKEVSADGLAKAIFWNETSGDVAADSSSQTQPAVLNGAEQNTSGWRGSGVSFDGQDDFADSFDFTPPEDRRNRTVATWVRLDHAEEVAHKQVIYDDGDVDRGLNIYVFEGNMYFGAWDIEANFATWLTVAINSNQWHHVAFSISSTGEYRVYFDGRLAELADVGGPISGEPGKLTIGASGVEGTRFHDGISVVGGNAGYFAGKLDETRIYNRLLNQGEIKSIALFRRLRFSAY